MFLSPLKKGVKSPLVTSIIAKSRGPKALGRGAAYGRKAVFKILGDPFMLVG